MEYPCRIREQEAQAYLAIRTRTAVADLPRKMRESYGAIMAYMQSLGQHPAGMPFTAYHNADMADLDVEIAIPAAKVLAGKGEIYGAEIPAGRVAECVYTGPYSGMAPAYQQLHDYVVEQGVAPTGVAYEIYIDDPGDTPQEALRTLIVFPLRQ